MAENVRSEDYGTTAVRLGFVTQTQVDECLAIQARMREMGIEEGLSDILGKKSYLTQEQTGTVLKALGLCGDGIPGYRLTSRIGQGGMGTVYKAVQTSINRTVAVKVLSNLAAKDPSYQKRFFEEAKAAGALNHRNIIGAIDCGQANGLCYFVMEHFEGRSLRAVLQKEGPLAETRALDVARQTAEALEYIHGHRMIHRDIKPENLMIGADGTIKLCDFGLARQEQSEQSLTMTGMSVGTPYYMAPEQVRGEKDVDIRGDLYSLGATLYLLTTGRFLFQGKTAAETMSLHLTQKVSDPRKHAPHLGADFANVILKLVEKDRAQRYQTPKELIEDLDRLRAGAAPAHARQHAAHRAARSTVRLAGVHARPATKSVVPLAVGAALVAIILIVALSGSRSPEPVPGPAKPAASAPSPPEIPVPAPSTSGPRVDQAREDAAAQRHDRAEALFKEGKWAEAREEWNGLLKECEGTTFLEVNRSKVANRLTECEGRDHALKIALDGIKALARPGSWAEAREKALKLLSSAETLEGRVQSELDRRIKAFDAEIKAEVLLAQVKEARARAQWANAHSLIVGLRKTYTETETVKAAEPDLERWMGEVHKELAAQQALQNAMAAKISKSWDQLVALLKTIATDHATTQTYAGARAELAELEAAVQGAVEDAAQSEWLEAKQRFDELCKQRKPEEARAVLKGWEGKYNLTAFYRKSGSDAIKKCRKSLDSAREDWALKLLSEAKGDATRRKWKECEESLEALAEQYADTKMWYEKQRDIKALQDACNQNLKRIDLGFEDEGSRLTPMAWGTARGRFEFDPGAHAGKKAGRIEFDATQDNQIAWVEYNVPEGLHETVNRVSVWLRNLDPGTPLTVNLVMAEDQYSDVFLCRVEDVGTEWKQYQVRLDSFQKVRGNGDGKLERAKIRKIGFSNGGRATPARRFLADDLRIDASKE